jgi:hypothetical protein
VHLQALNMICCFMCWQSCRPYPLLSRQILFPIKPCTKQFGQCTGHMIGSDVGVSEMKNSLFTNFVIIIIVVVVFLSYTFLLEFAVIGYLLLVKTNTKTELRYRCVQF